tara:strand:+ start:251 stop:892 length:642 start_codon:yes stop_codon:yes gene_type:complete
MSLVIKGSSSGQVTVDVPAAAGTNTLTIPAETGTVVSSTSIHGYTGQTLLSTTTLNSNGTGGTVIQFPLGYNHYKIVGHNCVVGTDAEEVDIQFSTSNFSADGGLESNFRYQRIEDGTSQGVSAQDDVLRLATNMGNDATDNLFFEVSAFNLTTDNSKSYGGYGMTTYGHDGDNHSYRYEVAFRSQTTGVVKFMKIFANNGTLTGTVLIFGIG